jgi:integrase
MPQPFKHPKSSVYYYRKVIPAALRRALGNKYEFRVSLGTKDLREAKCKYPEAVAKIDAILLQAAGGPVRLTHEQTVALAGVWYRRELEARQAEPEDPEHYGLQLGELQDADDRGKASEAVARNVDELLVSEGLLIDQHSRDALAGRIFWLKVKLFNALSKRAEGDYTPDPTLRTFPDWTPPQPLAKKPAEARAGDTFTSLVAAWITERKPQKRTQYEWERVLGRLEAHVGHDDPTRLSKADIVRRKDALLAAGKSPKTVENHLAAARALFSWAVRNERMATNPATGVGIAGFTKGKKSRLPYSDADAKLLLTAARKEKGALRWVPWLVAYTGARLEEVCQALVSDIRTEGKITYLDINADDPSKSLKNAGSVRKVPLHRAIIAEGFLKYVAKLPKDGPLFPDLTPDRFGRRGGNGTKIIGRWVRAAGVTDPRKAPNHSWRHRFKDLCRGAGIEKAVHDALTGHSSSDEGDKYGLGYPLATLVKAIEKLPDQLANAKREHGG